MPIAKWDNGGTTGVPAVASGESSRNRSCWLRPDVVLLAPAEQYTKSRYTHAGQFSRFRRSVSS